MARRRYLAQSVKETDGTVAERKSRCSSWTENGENVGIFGTEAMEIPRAERGGDVGEKLLIMWAVPELCLAFAEISLQHVSRKA